MLLMTKKVGHISFSKVAYNGQVYETWREKRFVVASGTLKP